MRAHVLVAFTVAAVGATSACRKPDPLVEPPPAAKATDKASEPAAAKKKPLKVPDVTPEAEWVAKLVRLRKSPRASKPKEILDNYMNAGRDRFFFDVAPVGEIEVSVVAVTRSAGRSRCRSARCPRPISRVPIGLDAVARDVGLKGVHWWKITRGTFAGHFVFQTLVRWVHSRDDACKGHAATADRCARSMCSIDVTTVDASVSRHKTTKAASLRERPRCQAAFSASSYFRSRSVSSAIFRSARRSSASRPSTAVSGSFDFRSRAWAAVWNTTRSSA